MMEMTILEYFAQLSSLKPNHSLKLKEELENKVCIIYGKDEIKTIREMAFCCAWFGYLEMLDFIYTYKNFTLNEIKFILKRSSKLNINPWKLTEILINLIGYVNLKKYIESEVNDE